MTTIKHITALIDASSLGTRTARAARTSVTAAEGDALARRAAAGGHGHDDSEEFRGRAEKRTYRPVSGSIPGRKKRKDKTMAKGHRCKDCVTQGVTTLRPTPYAGPRCKTHHLERRRATRERSHARHVEATYGITSEEYARLYLAQGGRCYVCQRASGATKRLAVDHDHNRGCGHDPKVGCRNCVRALLCGPCNQVVVGRYDAAALARAIMVLKAQPAQAILNGATDGR